LVLKNNNKIKRTTRKERTCEGLGREIKERKGKGKKSNGERERERRERVCPPERQDKTRQRENGLAWQLLESTTNEAYSIITLRSYY